MFRKVTLRRQQVESLSCRPPSSGHNHRRFTPLSPLLTVREARIAAKTPARSRPFFGRTDQIPNLHSRRRDSGRGPRLGQGHNQVANKALTAPLVAPQKQPICRQIPTRAQIRVPLGTDMSGFAFPAPLRGNDRFEVPTLVVANGDPGLHAAYTVATR
jgi:hypothetical protein